VTVPWLFVTISTSHLRDKKQRKVLKVGRVVGGMTMSLDGFVNDRHGDVGPLYPNPDELRQTELLNEAIRTTGAVVMGRRSYDMAQDDFTGYEFQVPIFVLTHHPPVTAAKGQNERLKIHFVTDGPESAIAKAKGAAAEKDVNIVGGVNVLHQLLQKGLVDELQIGIVPIFLGAGLRMFDGMENINLNLTRTRVIESPTRTDLYFRVEK
jgi:dihydrofolate reductase